MIAASTALVLGGTDAAFNVVKPTEDEIRWGISGNICRCTGYQNIVKAIQYAAAKINGVPFQEAAE